METITIDRSQVLATSPEGQTASLEVARLVELLAPRPLDVVYPDGLKREFRSGPLTVWVHQTSPRVHRLRWIAEDSPAPFGRGTTYRDVTIALPYVIVFAVFAADRHGKLQLTGANECFFRNEPIRSLDDALYYPALLNCSKFAPGLRDKPLSWICTQHLDFAKLQATPDDGARMRRAMQALLNCLFETGFNYSSEHHELSSWFSESRHVDPRVTTIEAWEDASRKAPLFVLEVPWLPVELSVRQVAERIVECQAGEHPRVASATDVARLVFNHGKQPKQVPR